MTCTPPISTWRARKNGQRLRARCRHAVRRCSSSRDRGPASVSTPYRSVTFSTSHRAVVGRVPLDPGQIVGLGRRRRDDVEAVRLEARDGQVALDPAPRRQHLRQGRSAQRSAGSRFAHSRSRNASAPGPGDQELREARLVEHADRRAHRTALLADRVEPVAAAERVLVAGSLAVAGEPERPLPAEAGAHDRALREQRLVQRDRS